MRMLMIALTLIAVTAPAFAEGCGWSSQTVAAPSTSTVATDAPQTPVPTTPNG